MEWNVLFFQSLLILLVASQVTNACSCNMVSWKEALCPGRGKTVVKATVISVERLTNEGNVVGEEDSASNARYQMRLESTLAIGSTPLDVSNGIFTMMFPLVSTLCGHSLSLLKEYLIVGNVYQGGIFYSNMCQLIIAMDDVDDNTNSVLNGVVELNCEDPQDRIAMADP